MKNEEINIEAAALALAALGASHAVKRVLEIGYEKVFKEHPPNNIDDREVNWARALGWAVVSGLAIAGTRTLIKQLGRKKVGKKAS